jgi:hypothetical protein
LKKKMIFSKEVDEYILSEPDKLEKCAPNEKKQDKDSAGHPIKHHFKTKSTIFGASLIHNMNEIRASMGLDDPKKRRRAMTIVAGFVGGILLIIVSVPGSNAGNGKHSPSPGAIIAEPVTNQPPAGSDMKRFMDEKEKYIPPSGPKIMGEEVTQDDLNSDEIIRPRVSAPVPTTKAEENEPTSMVVYRGSSATRPAEKSNNSLSPTGASFIRGKLIANIEASTAGGRLAMAQLEDGRVVFGNVRMAPDIDRIFITFREQDDYSDDPNGRVQYTVMDLTKTEGLKAICHDLSGSNAIKKGLSVGYNVASAIAGASDNGPISPQDIARERAAQQLENEAQLTEKAGRVRSCSVPAGTDFYAIQTGISR